MADKYVKLPRVIEELPPNEIRVRRDPRIGRYLNRANDLLTGKVEGFDGTIVIKGVAQAMENAVKLAELIKHRFTGLYQINSIETMETKDEYEPLEEGLDHLTFRRYTTMLTIVLTKDEPEDHSHYGYQDPIPDSEVQPFEQREPRERSVGSRSRL
jgi:DNA-binding protein